MTGPCLKTPLSMVTLEEVWQCHAHPSWTTPTPSSACTEGLTEGAWRVGVALGVGSVQMMMMDFSA